MPWCVRIAVGLAVSLACVPAAVGQGPPAPTKVKVELRWVEDKRVEGLTEDTGFELGEGSMAFTVYPHKKPALVLTAAEVSEARLTQQKFGTDVYYGVTLHLTKEARDKLAAAVKGGETRWVTPVVDGKCWGRCRFYRDQPGATPFAPGLHYFTSEAEARRVVDAFK